MALISSTRDFNNSTRLINLPAPAAPNDAARLVDITAALEGIKWKDARVAAPANVNLSAPGSTIDGVTLVIGDKFLAGNQTVTTANGIYVWNGAAVAATRALIDDSQSEMEGAIVTIAEGSTLAGTSWRQSTPNPVIGTDPILFVSFLAATPPATTTVSGTVTLAAQTEVDNNTGGNKVVTSTTLNAWSGKKFKAAANIGDASATSFNITHTAGTKDLIVQVYRNSGIGDRIDVDSGTPDNATVTVGPFSSAPSLNQFRVVIIG